MNISQKDEIFHFGNCRIQEFHGDGYGVRVGFLAIRYIERERAVTFAAEMASQPSKLAYVLPGFLQFLLAFWQRSWVNVTIDQPIFWDNCSVRPSTPDDLIVDRVDLALNELNIKHEIRLIGKSAE
jgi:hypothetical protein